MTKAFLFCQNLRFQSIYFVYGTFIFAVKTKRRRVGHGRQNLGKVCDISLTFPDNNWLGITVTGCKGFKLTNKKELFIPVGEIVKIGQDAILVKTGEKTRLQAPERGLPSA